MAQYRLEESLNSLDADSSSYSYSYKRDQCPKSPSPTLNTVASFSVCLRPCRDAGVVVVVVVVVVFVVVVVVVVSLSAPASIDLSLVVPAWNEARRISPMLDATLAYFKQRQILQPTLTFEVIVVDDGSSDETSQVCLCAVYVPVCLCVCVSACLCDDIERTHSSSEARYSEREN